MVMPTRPADEPPTTLADPRELLDGYLDYYRDAVLRKLDGLAEHDLRTSRLPSGWTPLELLKHLACMERRWFRWGFTAEPTDEPWADRGPDGRWRVEPDESTDEVRAAFVAACTRSREIATGVPLEQHAATGGRFATPDKAPTLGWIMFHVLQEYARHVGHLDIVRELADGALGE